jgi:hypothetical protein
MGDGQMFAAIFPHEMREAQAIYPILFATDPKLGGQRPVALFGLEEAQNLFLKDGRWDAAYLPQSVRMAPFLIGRSSGGLEVHIDLDHPRLSKTDGLPLFDADGSPGDPVKEASALLGDIHVAEQSLPRVSALLTELELLEAVAIDIRLDSGRQINLSGFQMINETRLQSLDGGALERLQAADALMPVFMAVASLGRMKDLIARLNTLDQASLT